MTTSTSQDHANVQSRIHDSILASFAADSFSLGAHWVYDSAKIKADYGNLVTLKAPLSDFHKKPTEKQAGDLTHIGYNSLLLLDTLAANSGKYQLEEYLKVWQSHWNVEDAALPGYKDHSTKDRLKHLAEGKTGHEAATSDDDMSHTIRWFPLLAVIHDEAALVQAAHDLTASFQAGHNERNTAKFYAHVLFKVIHQQKSPIVAIEETVQALNIPFLTHELARAQALVASEDNVEKAIHSVGPVKDSGGKSFYVGLSCGVQYGLPAFIYQAIRACKAAATTPLSQSIIDTVQAGGNSNARAIALAAVLYGWKRIEGDHAITEWSKNILQHDRIEQDLAKLTASSQ